MDSIHGHEVLNMMIESGEQYTHASLEAAIKARFGEQARFHTCSAEGMTAGELVKGAEQLKGAIMPITIIMGDCNYLKRVNDAYGHEYGDLLLKRVGRVIRENLPPESISFVCRG